MASSPFLVEFPIPSEISQSQSFAHDPNSILWFHAPTRMNPKALPTEF